MQASLVWVKGHNQTEGRKVCYMQHYSFKYDIVSHWWACEELKCPDTFYRKYSKCHEVHSDQKNLVDEVAAG